MSTRGRLIAPAVALLAAGAVLGVPVPQRTPAAAGPGCPEVTDGSVRAGQLAGPQPLAGCGLDGAVVTAGALAVRVPPRDGASVTAAAVGRDGHPAVLTVSRAGGAVRARIWPPDEAPRPARAPVERLGRAGPPATAPPPGPAAAPAPENVAVERRCADSAGTWLGMRWRGAYRWTFRTETVPAYLGDSGTVRDAVRAAGRAVDEGQNDCGLEPGLGLSQRYTGETGRDTNIRVDGTCGHRDDYNVIAFGALDGGLLALTCLWWSRGRTVEADVRINAAPGVFSLAPAAGCAERWDLQGTLTHEFGHVFGLGHVAYAQHGDLTMSDGLPACSTRFRTLGLGDYLTLRAQYGG